MPSDSSDFVSALPRLRRYARILAHDPRRADDIVKETLSRARKAEHAPPSDPTPLLPLLSLLRSVYVDLYAPGRARGPAPSFRPPRIEARVRRSVDRRPFRSERSAWRRPSRTVVATSGRRSRGTCPGRCRTNVLRRHCGPARGTCRDGPGARDACAQLVAFRRLRGSNDTESRRLNPGTTPTRTAAKGSGRLYSDCFHQFDSRRLRYCLQRCC